MKKGLFRFIEKMNKELNDGKETSASEFEIIPDSLASAIVGGVNTTNTSCNCTGSATNTSCNCSSGGANTSCNCSTMDEN